jgi:ketosteroid isomerase-like protein
MSQENAEFARSMAESVNNPQGIEQLARGDIDFSPFFDPKIEWDSTGARSLVPDLAGVYWGHEGVRTYWRQWLEAWRDLTYDVQDVLDAGDEVVVLICNQRQRGRYTGIVTELPPYAMVFTFRDGKIVRYRAFPDQVEALKAVGLEE